MSTPTNKAELIEYVATSTDLTKAKSAEVVAAVLRGITNTMASGNQLALLGFGTFLPKDRAEREGRNPKTGEAMTIPAARIPAFKAGKGLKDAVNSGTIVETANA